MRLQSDSRSHVAQEPLRILFRFVLVLELNTPLRAVEEDENEDLIDHQSCSGFALI